MSLQSIPILNPYFDLHEQLLPLLQTLSEDSSLQSPQQDSRVRSIRRKLVSAYAWAIPSRIALNAIAELRVPVLEIGAGTGYWAFCLSQLGVEIEAFDPNPHAPPHWFKVQPGNARQILAQKSGFSEGALFLCWPPLNEPMALECLEDYQGSTIIEVGEPRGGNTGTSGFVDALEKNFTLSRSVLLPRWPGANDSLRIWSR